MESSTKQTKSRGGLVALSAWRRDIGVSSTTTWRWTRDGLIHPINIAGRPYVTDEDIAQFQARAVAGEFSKAPAGAARASARERAERLSAPATPKEAFCSGA